MSIGSFRFVAHWPMPRGRTRPAQAQQGILPPNVVSAPKPILSPLHPPPHTPTPTNSPKGAQALSVLCLAHGLRALHLDLTGNSLSVDDLSGFNCNMGAGKGPRLCLILERGCLGLGIETEAREEEEAGRGVG